MSDNRENCRQAACKIYPEKDNGKTLSIGRKERYSLINSLSSKPKKNKQKTKQRKTVNKLSADSLNFDKVFIGTVEKEYKLTPYQPQNY